MTDLSKSDTRLALQGDKVRVFRRGEKDPIHLLTIIHVIGGTRSLRLVNREAKERQPDWTLTQALVDAFKPASGKDGAKWEVIVKV